MCKIVFGGWNFTHLWQVMENERSVYLCALRNIGEQPKTDSKKVTKELSVLQPIFTQWTIRGCDKSHRPEVNGALQNSCLTSFIIPQFFLLIPLLTFGCKTLQAHIVSYRESVIWSSSAGSLSAQWEWFAELQGQPPWSGFIDKVAGLREIS